MESENETRPLLHDFENETWRSKARKRCLRIPSEVAITGIILGLFFVVVTLLIVLENIEDTKDKDISVDKNLLASPFKYNKKAEDKTWQDKKDNMKSKRKQNDPKWDNANKGWKQFPDISGKIDNKWNQAPTKNLQDNVNNLELPAIVDGYGKDVEDSWEQLISKEEIDPSFFQTSYEDATDIASLSQSPKLHWNGIDDDWKRLQLQGWTDKEIRDALFQALKERKEEIKETEGLLQSPMNFNQLRDKINEGWKKKMEGGNTEMDYQEMKGKKEVEHQKSINDEWKNKITLLQSPKATMKNIVKADDGWKKLSEQGKKVLKRWKNLRDAFLKAEKKSTAGKASGSKFAQKRKYIFHDELRFLKKVYTERETADSYNVDVVNNEGDKRDNLIEVSTVYKEIDQTTASKSPQKSRKHKKMDEIDLKILKVLDKPQEQPNSEMSFFQSILPHVQNFNEDELLDFQMGVLKVISDIKSKRTRVPLIQTFSAPPPAHFKYHNQPTTYHSKPFNFKNEPQQPFTPHTTSFQSKHKFYSQPRVSSTPLISQNLIQQPFNSQNTLFPLSQSTSMTNVVANPTSGYIRPAQLQSNKLTAMHSRKAQEKQKDTNSTARNYETSLQDSSDECSERSSSAHSVSSSMTYDFN